jgi:hypothetical protein
MSGPELRLTGYFFAVLGSIWTAPHVARESALFVGAGFAVLAAVFFHFASKR